MRPQTRGPVALWLGLMSALVGLQAVRSVRWRLVHDAPLMHFLATRFAGSDRPYLDQFDMNLPGTYAVHGLLLRLLGPGDGAFRVFDLLVLAGCFAALVWLPRRRSQGWAAALVFAGFHLGHGAWSAGQRDYLICLPMLLAGLLLRRAPQDGRRRLGWLALAGLCAGLPVTIKPHAVLFAGLGAVGLGWARLRAGRMGAGLLEGGLFLASAALPGGVMTLWLATSGLLGPFLDVLTGYVMPLYSQVGPSDFAEIDLRSVLLAGALLPALGVALWRARSDDDVDPALWLGLGGAAYGAVHLIAQDKGWWYHFYPLMAFLPLAAATSIRPTPHTWQRAATALSAVALLLGLGLLIGRGWGYAARTDKLAMVDDLVGYLEPRLEPEDQIQVLDTAEGGIHALLLLGRTQPTRFIYDFHFYHHTEEPVIQALRTELVAGLRGQPPAWIVLFRNGWPQGGYERLDGFPALADVLDELYGPPIQRRGFRLYPRRAGTRP